MESPTSHTLSPTLYLRHYRRRKEIKALGDREDLMKLHQENTHSTSASAPCILLTVTIDKFEEDRKQQSSMH